MHGPAPDLSPRIAAERAAEANANYHGLCWKNTFTDIQENNYPFWAGLTEAHRISAIRAAIITIYSYLHFRSRKDIGLEEERLLFLQEIELEWRPIISRSLGIPLPEMERRKPRRAFGHDLSVPVNDLFAFVNDQETGAALLLESYRREEIRRLEYKAHLLKNGPLSEQDMQSDEFWARKNRETFQIADDKIALAKEAREAADARSEVSG